MTFNNPLFYLIFLPLCIAGFAIFGRFGRRSAIGFLAFMSIVFYAAWSLPYVILLSASILWNFFISHRIFDSKGRRTQTDALAGHRYCRQPGRARLLQIFVPVFGPGRFAHPRAMAFQLGHPSVGHLVLHLHPDRLPRRPQAGRRQTRKLHHLHLLRHLLPTPRRGPHPASQRPHAPGPCRNAATA